MYRIVLFCVIWILYIYWHWVIWLQLNIRRTLMRKNLSFKISHISTIVMNLLKKIIIYQGNGDTHDICTYWKTVLCVDMCVIIYLTYIETLGFSIKVHVESPFYMYKIIDFHDVNTIYCTSLDYIIILYIVRHHAI